MTVRGVRLRWTQLAAMTVILVAAVLTAFTLATLVQNTRETSEKTDRLLEALAETQTQDTREATEHRSFNQHDHDCIVALALILGDPNRNRELPPALPPSCERAPAVERAEVTGDHP